jgi:hypothetical protein
MRKYISGFKVWSAGDWQSRLHDCFDRGSIRYEIRSVGGCDLSPHVELHEIACFLRDLVAHIGDIGSQTIAEQESHLPVVDTILVSLDQRKGE